MRRRARAPSFSTFGLSGGPGRLTNAVGLIARAGVDGESKLSSEEHAEEGRDGAAEGVARQDYGVALLGQLHQDAPDLTRGTHYRKRRIRVLLLAT